MQPHTLPTTIGRNRIRVSQTPNDRDPPQHLRIQPRSWITTACARTGFLQAGRWARRPTLDVAGEGAMIVIGTSPAFREAPKRPRRITKHRGGVRRPHGAGQFALRQGRNREATLIEIAYGDLFEAHVSAWVNPTNCVRMI